MQKTEQVCGVMTELLFSTRKREKTVKPQANFSFCECNAKNPKQTNKRHSKSRWDYFDREAGPEGTGGGSFGRETETGREKEILFTRPNENHHTQCFIHFSVDYFFFHIVLCYIILYCTRLQVQVYYMLGVMERREGGICIYVCV